MLIRLLLFYFIYDLFPNVQCSMKLGHIGQPCRINEKDQCILPNSECVENICMCASFYKYINGSCITDQSKTLGKHCRGGGDCRGQGEFCSSFSICMCLSTHVDVGSQCKPVIYPGQFGCEDSLQCNKGFPGAECDVSRVCVCPHGMFVNQQTCVVADSNSTRSTIINDLMLQNVIMADHRQINKSDFRGNFFRRRNYDAPRNFQISPDSTCSYDNQCSGYPLAICDTVCKCVRGALNTGTTCISSSSALQSSVSCPAGQTYIREAGVCMTVQQPGEPCQYSQQCSALEPGAYCLKMRCECVYGMKKSSNGCTFVNNDCKERGYIFISEVGECRQVIPPGGRGCSHNLQCSGAYPDATCFMQTCTCPPNLPVAADGTCGRSCSEGYVYSGVTGECLPEVQPGEPCLYSSQCQAIFGGMVCDKNTCRCPNGLVFDGSKCSASCVPPQVIENDICVNSCSGQNVDVSGRCLPIVAIGQSCSGNAQCRSGSFCQNGSCQCPPGFFVDNDQCQAVESEPNGSCRYNEKCTKGSVCYNGICTCPRNQVLVNGNCEPKQAAVLAYNTAVNNIRKIRLRFANNPTNQSVIESRLTNLNESIIPIGGDCSRIGVVCDGGSTCVSFKCICPLGTTPRNGICVKHVTANPGESCENGEECIENSICNEETMTCDCVSKTKMIIGNKCIERLRSHPGYGCSMGEICIGQSICVEGRCKCPAGKIERQKICIDPILSKLGEMCGEGVICQEGSYCDKDLLKCSCPKGFREVNGQCKQVTIVYPGELCTDVTSRCAGGSFCVRGRCECSLNMKVVNKKCVIQKTAYPGESCYENTVCASLSVCKNNICTCVNDMIIRDRACIQRRRASIGDSCDKYDNCLGNSTCVDKYCQCPVGHINSGNICVQRKTVAPGFLCNPEDICTGQSVCIKGMCQCKPNYKLIHNLCVKNSEGSEGVSCHSKEDCLEGLNCIRGACSCPEGLFSVNGRCRSYIQLGQLCTTEDRCRDKNSYCSGNVCSCKEGYANINGECVSRIVTPAEPEAPSQMKAGLIGHFCLSDSNCKVVNSYCRLHVCICKDGFRIFGSTQCIPRVAKENKTKQSRLVSLGEKCGKLELCQKGAICHNEICVCPEGFINKENVCVKQAKIRVIVPPLSSCENGEICSGNSECVHGLCFCKEDFTLFHGSCQKLKKIESMTIIDIDHTKNGRNKSRPIPDTTSSKELTTTPVTTTTDYIPTPIKISMKLGSTKSEPMRTSSPEPTTTTESTSFASTPFWFKIVKPGHACDSLSFCTNCSVCSNGFCVCPEGLELHGERCVSHIDAQKCVASNQCPSGANCVRGECKCKPGLGLSRLGFCIPINYADPGTSCSNGERCRSDSQCIDGICVCPESFILKENKCVRSIREKRHINNDHRKLLNFTPKKFAKLGEFCMRDDHCEHQKLCVKNICQCQRNFVQSSFSCVPRMSVVSNLARPGESCRIAFCIGGSTCTNFICKCPFNYYKLNDACIRIEARIGAPCGSNTECSSGSECMSSFCQCQDQYDADKDECYPISNSLPNRKNTKSISGRKNRIISASTINCPIGYDLVNGMCVNSETLSVIQLAEPGDTCEDGRILCTGNSVCANNVCICPGGEIVQNGTCVPVNSFSAPGEACDLENTICTGNSQCVDGICKCPELQGSINGKCANIGNGITCGQGKCGMNQMCVQNECQCKMGYYKQPGNCVSGACNCIQQDQNTNECQNKQCGLNQICAQNNCQCQAGYFPIPESCVEDRCNCIQQNVQNSCDKKPCGNNQICLQDTCQCKPGYYRQPETCYQDRCNCAPEQNSCDPSQCGLNQICVQNQCECKTGYYPQTDTCNEKRCNCIQQSAPSSCVGSGCSVAQSFSPFFGLPGQMCDMRPDTTRCRNNALCINNHCACPSDKVLSGSECVKYFGDALPGQSCSTPGIICRGGSSCNQNICSCTMGFTINGDKCTPVIEIKFTMVPLRLTTPSITFELHPGQACNPNCAYQPCLQRCSGGSSCINSVCTCPSGSYVYNNVCTPEYPSADSTINTKIARPGEMCDNSIICIGGSSCIIGTCTCDRGYTPSFDRTSCILIDRQSIKARSYPKTFCTFDSECKDGTICIDKRCSCRQNEEMINGKCISANQPGTRCHTSYCSRGSECRNGYCVCAKTLHSNSTRHCVSGIEDKGLAYPGSKCSKSTLCQMNSSCLFGFCSFPNDEIEIEEMRNIKSAKNQRNRKLPTPSNLSECPIDGSCQTANCFCTSSGKVPPKNLEIKHIPQMVMLTFDDPITDRIINTLKSLFSGKIRNPNGCPIKGTFFISHQWNNYDQSQWLFSKGNEIAVNSITREDLSRRTKERWIQEQRGMRDTLSEFSYVEKSQIIGARAPNFKLGGDSQLEMLKENNFTFDNSMLVNGLFWPQTLDYKLAWECDGNCPQKVHKGVWEIPIQNIQGNDGMWYTMMSHAIKPSDSRVSVKQMLMRNFLNNYKTNKAPFVVTLNTDFLTYLPDNGAIYALEDFLKEIVQKKDVFIVTGSQVIDWMKNPTITEQLRTLRSWQCNYLMNDHIQLCESPSVCSYNSRFSGQLAHSFRICGSCPKKYPWI